MMIQNIAVIFILLALVFGLTACTGSGVGSPAGGQASVNSNRLAVKSGAAMERTPVATPVTAGVVYDSDDIDSVWKLAAMSDITLKGDEIEFKGNGAIVDGSKITITSPGMYNVSGTLNDGQIVVSTRQEGTVRFVLNGVSVLCSTGAPFYIINAEKTVITLAEGSVNRLEDGDTYIFDDPEEAEPDAVLFSKDDLTVNGGGSLVISANFKNGIDCKDDLKITGGSIAVNAVNDCIRGRDSIAVRDGDITLNAGGDGLQSNNDEEEDKGYIVIEGGTVRVESADDAIVADNYVIVEGGCLDISSGGDGIHADRYLEISGGRINITQSYEGLESAVAVINDGDIHLVSGDDGINCSSGSGESRTGGRPGPGEFEVSGSNYLNINGGYIFVDARGDGLDINGPVNMSGGTVIINGPTGNGNGALDFSGAFNITGGYLVAAGSSGMAQPPSDSSAQYAVMVNFDSPQAAGSIVHIESEEGLDLLTFMPAKAYQSVVLCSTEMQNGLTCVVYCGGSSSGTAVDGLYMGGEYSPGSEFTTFTVSAIVTRAGSATDGRPGGGAPGEGFPVRNPGGGFIPGGARR
ncbi:MAG: carbohydrate-binding domain-containing protein [Dehalococcoidales bacterium]|nr:carbohydrate-binding domain-containing protein [Dehalococcoidales bacterium]